MRNPKDKNWPFYTKKKKQELMKKIQVKKRHRRKKTKPIQCLCARCKKRRVFDCLKPTTALKNWDNKLVCNECLEKERNARRKAEEALLKARANHRDPLTWFTESIRKMSGYSFGTGGGYRALHGRRERIAGGRFL